MLSALERAHIRRTEDRSLGLIPAWDGNTETPFMKKEIAKRYKTFDWRTYPGYDRDGVPLSYDLESEDEAIDNWLPWIGAQLWPLEYALIKGQARDKYLKEQHYRALSARDNEQKNGKTEKEDYGPKAPKGYHFVTISPKPDITLEELTQKVDHWKAQTHIESVEYVYEQRSSIQDEMGTGIHIHAIVKTDAKPSSFKTRTHNTFKNLVGNVNRVDIKPLHYEKFIQDKRDYMKGEKTGVGKGEKVKIDKIWRSTVGLEDYYEYVNEIII